MSVTTDAIEKLLDKRIPEEELNHYKLLGVDHRATNEEIKQALRTASASWNANAKNHPGAAQLVANLLRQAQAVLLDAEKRRAYDAQLPLVVNVQVTHFPSADPFASFQPAVCLRVAATQIQPIQYGSPNERWQELIQRIPSLANLRDLSIGSTNKLDRTQNEAIAPSAMPNTKSEVSSIARVETLRRNRKNKQKHTAIGLLISAAVILVVATIAVLWPQNSNQKQVSKLNSNSSKNKDLKTAPPIKQKPLDALDQPSGLPSLNKNEDEAPSGKTATPSENHVNDMSTSTKAAPVEPKAVEPSSPQKEEPENSTERIDSASWVEAMKKAKAAIAANEFATFHDQIKIANQLGNSEERKVKSDRLDQLGQLQEIFVKALRAGKSKLNSGDTLNVGSRKVGIVEANEKELILKVSGNSEKYVWDKLPLAYALAIVDLELSKDAPTDLAARAVYCSLSKLGNEIFNQRCKEWFEKSCGKGGVRTDLPQALEDVYE